MKVQKVDAALLNTKAPRAMSAREQARIEQERRVTKMLDKLSGPDVAFRVRPEGDEKLSTIEARIRKMAAARDQKVLLRRMENSVVVGLRSARGDK